MRTLRTMLATAALAAAVGSLPSEAPAYNELKTCGLGSICLVVDVLDRGLFNETFFSDRRVHQAWVRLVDRGPCPDLTDVVVGGTFGENGSPGPGFPAGFAVHVAGRCTLVVHYELEGPVIDAQAYEDSVEHGRKALAIVLRALDFRRRRAGFTGRVNVWGHSKGAAIVESTWRMEARNRQSKFITRLSGRNRYVDACPSNNCFYFGFGYPWHQEQHNRFSISRATSTLWDGFDDGYIDKPPRTHNDWHRLTTFTNLSDPVYECHLSCAWQLVFNSRCHRYEDFLSSRSYSYFTSWNRFNESSAKPPREWIGNHCGVVGDPGTFELVPADTVVRPQERVRLALEWTVPEGGWRVLDEIQLRLRDGDDILLWLRFDEAANLLGLYDAKKERFLGAAEPGSRTTLNGRGARLHAAGSRVLADGAADPSVILDLELSFKRRAAGKELIVEVLATDDLGGAQNFQPAGKLTVVDDRRRKGHEDHHRRHDDDHDRDRDRGDSREDDREGEHSSG